MLKTGYITIIGKPNAGKSTLINKLVGFKVAITTPKPQTTRFNIKGIVTTNTSQMVILDTPGVHLPKNKMGEYMMQSVKNAISSVDVIIYLVDGIKYKIDKANEKIIEDIISLKTPVILCINKVDRVDKGELLNIIKEYNDYFSSIGGNFSEIIPISVYKEDGIDVLISNIEKYLKESQLIYAEDEITDMSQREIVEELIREKALNNLDEEVPHGLKVEIEKFEEKEKEGNIVYNIEANIICGKDSHKSIVIGKNGSMIQRIKKESRKDAKELLEADVNLSLFVKVRKDWQKNDLYLKNIKSKI